MDFSNKVILITGASSGIGRTLLQIMRQYKAKVIGIYNNTYIDEDDYYKCDIKKEKDIKNLFKIIKKKYHKIDVLVNLAAYYQDNDMYDKSKKEFMDVLEVNLVGTFLMCKYASSLMDFGVIVNMSSTDATDTFNPLSMDYCASKAGIENLTKTLAMRLKNIRVCALAPNYVNTESVMAMDPEFLKSELERIGQKELLRKEDVALKIIEIIINSDFVSGSVVRMDGKDE